MIICRTVSSKYNPQGLGLHVQIAEKESKPIKICTNLIVFLGVLVDMGSPGSVFTYHSQEYSLSFSPRFSKFECNTAFDWLNRMV